MLLTDSANFSACETSADKKWHCDTILLTVAVTTNTLVILSKCLYVALLARNASLRELSYFWIIVNITIADIITCNMIIASALSCYFAIRGALSRLALNILLTVLTNAAYSMRFYLVGFSAVERYCAICLPHDYCNIKSINNAGKCSLVLWVAHVMLQAIKHLTILFVEKCYEDIFGDVYYSSLASLVINFIPLIIGAVLLIKMWKGVSEVANTNAAEQYFQELKDAGRYVTFSTLGIFCFLMIPSFTYLIAIVSGFNSNALKWALLLFQSTYGLVNMFLYVYFHPNTFTKEAISCVR